MTFGHGATVVPGERIYLLDNHLQSTAENAALYAMRQNRSIANPKVPLVPTAAIEAPASIGLCDDLTLDGGPSTGSGGRNFVYNWSLATFGGGATEDSIRNISLALKAAADVNTAQVTLERKHIPVNAKLTFSLTVRNFLGHSAATSMVVRKGAMPAPLAYVQGANPRVAFRSSEVKLKLSASQPQLCEGITLSGSTMAFYWSELTGRFAKAGGSLTTINPRTLRIPANTLVPGETYEFQAVVSIQSDPTDVNTTAVITVVCISQPIVAVLAGGDTRQVRQHFFLCLFA